VHQVQQRARLQPYALPLRQPPDPQQIRQQSRDTAVIALEDGGAQLTGDLEAASD